MSTVVLLASFPSVGIQASHETGGVIGNRRSLVYHAPGCPNGAALSVQNRVVFASAAAAQAAGYRAGRDCHR